MASLDGHHGSTSLRVLSLAFLCVSLATRCAAPAAQVPLQHDATREITWEDCGEAANHTLQCSTIEVPMDQFGTSSDETFTIPLLRLLAANASATGDRHIFFNPGGPGGSGVKFLRGQAAHFSKIVGEEFHLLSFDPRGVGGSKPNATCYVSREKRAYDFNNSPWDVEFEAGAMYTNAENMARACQDLMGDHGKFINTPQTAADMNSILDALGQKEMYYWGFSYGTTLGQTYAQMFPERVGRLVIDGVSNLKEWYGSGVENEVFTDTDKIFNGFFQECIKHSKDCPLSSVGGIEIKSADELKRYIEEYLKQLEEEPIPVYINAAIYGSVTRQKLVANGIFFALYSPMVWPKLAHELAELINGNNTPAFLAYSSSRVADILPDDSFTFVIHNDNRLTGKNAPAHGIDDIRNYTKSAPQQSDLVSRYRASDVYTGASWRIETTHNFHPRYSPESPPVKTAHPLLILSTTLDPVCPLISAKAAWRSFEGAGFIEQKSYGHCTLSMPSLCTVKHVRRYLNKGTLPNENTTCEIDREYFESENSLMLSLSAEDKDLYQSMQALAESEDIWSPIRF